MQDVLGSVCREIRRKYYFFFKMDYVKCQIKKRQGKCGMHGCCASQPKIFRCKFLKRKKCLLFGTNKMPFKCKIYPFDEKDKSPFSKKYCNFHWKRDKKI
jgi:hypothetical protein